MSSSSTPTPHDFRRAKIVCTIGPACDSPETFEALVDAGMNVVRINFSHAGHEEARRIITLARRVARDRDRPLAVIADLQGPRIRVGELVEPLEIHEGRRYRFVPEATMPVEGDPPAIPTTYSDLASDVAPGDRILLDDGRLELEAVAVGGDTVEAEARNSGPLESQKGINLPGVNVRAPSLTEKDLEDLAFANEIGVDYVALSFVRRPEDVADLRDRLPPSCLIISKIEKDSALDNVEEILRRSDGVMVARGDLGVELPYEEVPMVQKRLIDQGQWMARPTITATQMLDSMISSPRPTRAEVSDVANALMDGTDAVMLSAETAVGDYPVEAVGAMLRIIHRVEQETPMREMRAPTRRPEERAEVQRTTSAAIAAASLEAVDRLNAPAVVTLTRSGFTARVMSAQRPPVPILAVTDQPNTYNQLALVWGVLPVMLDGQPAYEPMLERARDVILEEGLGRSGEHVVVTAGVPFHVPGTTNMMRIEEL
jgi:pyruvate kinase